MSSAATLSDDQAAVAITGGMHGAVFGPALGAIDGRLRLGLRDDLELVVNGGAYIVLEDSVADEHRGIYTGRAGLKYRLQRHVAMIAGVGGGLSPTAGVFAGADFGFIFAYENPYCIPFVALRGFYNIPIRPSGVDVGIPGTDEPGDIVVRPADTLGGTLEFGVRAPVGREDRFNLLLSGMFTALYDGRGGVIEEHNTLWLGGFMTGFEARFGAAEELPN